ncbi:MAG: hypothetical protein M3N12_07850 [Verrucomicrobiota bacterium]|nr:hypothetical protein [Verrucomicrobiota bacterium]
MKTIAFIFVPVYVERNPAGAFQAKRDGALRKVRHLLFAQRQRILPFWTWFIDNPRPSSAAQK